MTTQYQTGQDYGYDRAQRDVDALLEQLVADEQMTRAEVVKYWTTVQAWADHILKQANESETV